MAATETATRATQALDGLYRAHAREVYRYAYTALGNHADAEDVTQTTFVNALRALERGDRPRRPSSWLIAIAHNVVRQRFRTQRARPAEVELDHDIAVEPRGDDGPTLHELVQALQRIPHTQREALVMRELEGRTYGEIRDALELTPAALEMLLFRARRSLTEELESVVTCKRAEIAIEQRHGGRLSRKERRRLLEHLRECPACARLDASRKKRRRRLGALALFPLPFSLTFFRGTKSAAAATGAPAGGGLAAGAAVKALALAAAVTTVASAGYVGVEQIGGRGTGAEPAVSQSPARGHSVRRPIAPVLRRAEPDAAPRGPAPRSATPPVTRTPGPALASPAASPTSGAIEPRPAPRAAEPAAATAARATSPPQQRARPEKGSTSGAAVAEPTAPTPATAEQPRPEPELPARATVAATEQPELPAAQPEPASPATPDADASAPAAPAPAPPAVTPPAPAASPAEQAAASVVSAPSSDAGTPDAGTPDAGTPDAAAAAPPLPVTPQQAPPDGGRRGHGRQDGEHAWGRDREPPGTPTRTRRGWSDGR